MTGKIQKERYLRTFLIGFCVMALCYVPFLIMDKGLFIYFGDYNAQQIPFYKMMHDAVRNGNIFWNFNTDLGTNTIGSYSFYLLGSPFFWLTIPFPSDFIPYMMPFLMCLKYGIATLTSYAYIRRFVKNVDVALIGAVIYAFSGFSSYNIFFNHFHDVICFFPLVLIGLEEAMVNNRKGCFALSVALLATVNYYFFAGQVVFLIIYFIVRLIYSKEFKLTFSKFLSLAFESVVGVGISAVLLFPAVIMVLGNPRVDSNKILLGYRMVYYGYGYEYLNIIQSMFFVPDIPSSPNFFTKITDKWSSVAVYLPLFSMAGVIAFFGKFKKHWVKTVLLICAFMAFVPFLNSAFQLFNGAYYARWYYMPILIMALSTAILIDKHGLDLKFGILATTFVTVVFGSLGILPKYNTTATDSSGKSLDGYVSFGDLPISKTRFWLTVSFSLVSLVVLALLYGKRRSKHILRYTLICTILMSLGSTLMMMTFSRAQGPSTDYLKNDVLNQKFSFTQTDGEFYRIDDYNCMTNASMYWESSSIQSFHSIIPASAFDFYHSIGVPRFVKTSIPYDRYAVRGLTSVKYSIDSKESDTDYEDMPGFEYIGDEGNYSIYENMYFVPMGYMYDCYFDTEQFESINANKVDRLYMHGLYLSDEQIKEYSAYMSELDKVRDYQLTQSDYLECCTALQKNACSYFKYDNKGFTAKANTSKAGLMVFSVPYDTGWSAVVNGKEVKVENVQNGFMAVLVPEGDVNIRFNYKTPGLKLGLAVSITSTVLLILYLLLWNILKKSKPDKFATIKYAHLNELETVTDIALMNEYALNCASEELPEDNVEEEQPSADFLRVTPKAVNAFVPKIKQAKEPEKPQEEEKEELLSDETRRALENLGGNIDLEE